MIRAAQTSRLACLSVLMFASGLAASAVWAQSPPPKQRVLPVPSASQQKLAKTLSERTEIAFTDSPLTDSLDYLKDYHQTVIVVDVHALEVEGVDPSTPITLQVFGIALRSALKLMLDPLELTAVHQNEVILVTTKAAASQKLVTRVYPVPDLAKNAEELESLMQAVKTGIADAQWKTTDKPVPGSSPVVAGSISVVNSVKSLVICQTEAAHEQALELLDNLRLAGELAK